MNLQQPDRVPWVESQVDLPMDERPLRELTGVRGASSRCVYALENPGGYHTSAMARDLHDVFPGGRMGSTKRGNDDLIDHFVAVRQPSKPGTLVIISGELVSPRQAPTYDGQRCGTR